MNDSIRIENNGPAIVETNYWASRLAANNLAFLSTNAGAFRLLIPPALEEAIPEFHASQYVIVSIPRNPSPYAVEILFEDGSKNPYCLHLSAAQLDRLPAHDDDGRIDLELTVLTPPRRGEPHQAMRRPARFRFVPRVPWIKPW